MYTAHSYKKFPNLCAGGFSGSKNAKICSNFKGMLKNGECSANSTISGN